jgi:hypothetical protein
MAEALYKTSQTTNAGEAAGRSQRAGAADVKEGEVVEV